MKEVYLTAEGLEELKEKLNYLLTVKRVEVAEKIKIAREFGDLSENAEYDAAKEEQSFVEAEIKEIESKIMHAAIIDDAARGTSEVSLGCTVKLYDEKYKEELEYRIVGTTEANVAENRISNESPLGVALMGHKKDERVEVLTPNGDIIVYKIIDIA